MPGDIHVHNTFNIDGREILQRLDHIIKHQHEIMGALDDIKAKLAVSDEKITILSTATEGVAADIAAIKAKLEAATNGLDAAGVAEVLELVQGQSDRLSETATKLSELDAQTDPNA